MLNLLSPRCSSTRLLSCCNPFASGSGVYRLPGIRTFAGKSGPHGAGKNGVRPGISGTMA
ncbi:hypothetical protein DSECCO2_621550 [anaerobic digester metagenome]